MTKATKNGMWSEFEKLFSDLTGLFLLAYDEEGTPLTLSRTAPSLCAFLGRNRETRNACLGDCHRRLKELKGLDTITTARCYAGLSYRIIPVRPKGERPTFILLGKVITDIYGDDQAAGFMEQYHLDRSDFLNGLRGMRHFSESELDRLARFVQRFALYAQLKNRQSVRRAESRERDQRISSFARQVWGENGAGRNPWPKVLEIMTAAFQARGAALFVPSTEGGGRELLAAEGSDDSACRRLAAVDWKTLLDTAGQKNPLVSSDLSVLERAGLKPQDAPLVAYRLVREEEIVGHVLLAGGEEEGRDGDLLECYCQLLAPRLLADLRAKRWRRKDDEFSMLSEVAKQIFAAGKVEDILPRTLEEAMHIFRSRRGSILLAEGKDSRVTASAMRGDHAEISSDISSLHPDSVSYRVFHEKRPLLVHDADRETGGPRDRRFPYSSQSFISVPLRENGHALGVLHLTEREGGGSYTTLDLSMLDLLSGQASAAIQKARMRDEVEDMRVQSVIDPLTGIYNRRYLDSCLAGEMARTRRFGQPLSLVMVDIDDFKSVNDALGNPFGDRVLRGVATELLGHARSIDILARYGGEEFVLLLPGTDAAGAAGLAEKLRAHIEGTDFLGGGPTEGRRLTISAGVASYESGALTSRELLERADQALRQAKSLGKNTALPWGGKGAAVFPSERS